MSTGCFIGIDQGSSSTKTLAVGADGGVLVRIKKDVPPPFRQENRIEYDALALLGTVEEALNETVERLRDAGHVPRAIGLSCQRSSCLVWNEQSGEPLSPVISWRDMRGADLVSHLSADEKTLFESTGLPLTPYYSASKFRWLRDNMKPLAGSAVFGTLSSFLSQRLTGTKSAVIDHTNAARTQLMNIHTLDWDRSLIELFGLSGITLPRILPTAFDFGDIRTTAGSVPLLACIGDQQAAMLGQGVVERGDGGINYGTGGFLMVNTGKELVPVENLMASMHYSRRSDRCYLLEGSVNAVGDALAWLRNNFRLFSDFEELDDLCWQAATDTVAFIGLNGTGAPHWERAISSSFHGLTQRSTTADIIRGVVENIAFFMQDIMDAISGGGLEPRRFAVSGGLSALSYLTQIQADIFGKELLVSTEQEVSARGAAFLAGLACNVWTSAEIKRMAQQAEVITPRQNAGVGKRYRRWKELHRMTAELDLL